MAHFGIEVRKKTGEVTLYFRIKRRQPKFNNLFNSHIRIDYDKWVDVNKSETKWKNFLRTFEGQQLKAMYDTLNGFIDKGIFDKDFIDVTLNSIAHPQVGGLIQSRTEEEERLRILKLEEERNDILAYLHTRIEAMSNKTAITKNGRPYKANSIRAWKDFEREFAPFYMTNKFGWDDINNSNIDKFIAHLSRERSIDKADTETSYAFMDATINDHLQRFSTLVKAAYNDFMHDNIRASQAITKKYRKVRTSDKVVEVYLTGEEVQALYDMPLIGDEAKARDIFLIGCYTGQRISDYCHIGRSNFSTTAKGNKVIRLEQQKTGNEVVIPIVNNNIITIMERNDYDLTLYNKHDGRPLEYVSVKTYINQRIKAITERLANDVPSLAQEISTRLTQRQIKGIVGCDTITKDDKGFYKVPKWKLISSHTARRTGVTLLYLSKKLDIYQMMSISGHRTQHIFESYIKLSKDELADSIVSDMNRELNIMAM